MATPAKKAKKSNEDQLADLTKKIGELEETVANITLVIGETERDLEKIERECNGLIKQWLLSETDPSPEEQLRRTSELDKLHCKEEELDKQYENSRREKDQIIRELRLKYAKAIKLYHKIPEKSSTEKKGVVKVKQPLTHNSSLLSGTSMSGIDDVDYVRIFKVWEIDASILNYEKKDGPKAANYYCKVRDGDALGKKVCVKEYPSLQLYQYYSTCYSDVKKIVLGHRYLATPIAAIYDNLVLTELFLNQYPTLKDILDASRNTTNFKLGFAQKLHIGKCIAEGMAWLHAQGAEKDSISSKTYLHLRLKPSNIFFTRDWKIKVGDFGLGVPLGLDCFPTDTENIFEKLFETRWPHYAAPELLKLGTRDSKNAGLPSCDLWSFGMILYTLVTDSIPFSSAKSYDDVKESVLSGKLDPLPADTPKTLQHLYTNLLSADPQARESFESITERNVWSTIHGEALSYGEESASKIWEEVKKEYSPKADKVTWEQFSRVLWKHLGNFISDPSKTKIHSPDDYENAFKSVIAPKGTSGSYEISKENFFKFVGVFKPLRTGAEGHAYATSIVELCKKPFFLGFMDRASSEALINFAADDKTTFGFASNPNPCLVRLSANTSNKFCFSYFKKGDLNIVNQTIEPNEYSGSAGFMATFQQMMDKHKVKPIVRSKGELFELFDEKNKTLIKERVLQAKEQDKMVSLLSIGTTRSGQTIIF